MNDFRGGVDDFRRVVVAVHEGRGAKLPVQLSVAPVVVLEGVDLGHLEVLQRQLAGRFLEIFEGQLGLVTAALIDRARF